MKVVKCTKEQAAKTGVARGLAASRRAPRRDAQQANGRPAQRRPNVVHCSDLIRSRIQNSANATDSLKSLFLCSTASDHSFVPTRHPFPVKKRSACLSRFKATSNSRTPARPQSKGCGSAEPQAMTRRHGQGRAFWHSNWLGRYWPLVQRTYPVGQSVPLNGGQSPDRGRFHYSR